MAWNVIDLLNTKQKYTEIIHDIQNKTYHKWISQEKIDAKLIQNKNKKIKN